MLIIVFIEHFIITKGEFMNILLYYILVSFLPLIANFVGYLISMWSAYELEDLNKYLDTGIRIIFVFMLGFVLSELKFAGFIILIVFILYSLSRYFWKFEKLNLLIFAILVVLVPNPLILTLIFVYFIISTTLAYYKLHKTKETKLSMYPMHAVHFMKKYWTYYLFILVVLVALFYIVLVI